MLVIEFVFVCVVLVTLVIVIVSLFQLRKFKAGKPTTKLSSEYQIARRKDLILADLIDWAIIMGLNLIVLWPPLFALLRLHLNENTTSVSVIPFLLIPLTALLYHLLFGWKMQGQTLGKRARCLRLVGHNGVAPSFRVHVLQAAATPFVVLVALPFAPYFGFSLLNHVGVLLLALALIVIMKHSIRNGQRLGGLEVVSYPRMKSQKVVGTETKEKPEPPAALIDNIAAVSQYAKRIYFIYAGLLAYCALTVAGSTDSQIILSEPTTLPIINTKVSMDGFFILAPLLSIFFFVYFQIYLGRLRLLFHRLRSNYQPIDESERIHPWMLNFAQDDDAGLAARIIVSFSVWWSLPVVLMILALWYLKKHEPILGSFVGLMPLVGTMAVVSFWAKQPGRKIQLHRPQRILVGVVLLFEIYFFGVFVPRAFRGENIIGAWPAVDVSHQNLVTKQDTSFTTLYWVNLRESRLEGANFTGVILHHADLRDARLEGATLIQAQLQRANLSGANLTRADLTDANIANAVIDRLRSSPETLDEDMILHAVAECGFYDSLINPAGDYPNIFELRTVEGDSVVTDRVTGLTWQQSQADGTMFYTAARQYVEGLNEKKFAGFQDWRLPTLDQAKSLVEPVRNHSGLHIAAIFGIKKDVQDQSKGERRIGIWTSDKYGISRSWVSDFRFGSTFHAPLDSGRFYVRAVRSGQ